MTMKEADDARLQSTAMADRGIGALALRPARKDVTGLELIVKKARSSVGTSATGSADVPEEVLTPTALLSVEAVGQPRRSP
ncbi:hypothetical protein V6N11_054531 [Hibiscus sabdariffa]|uniref:Uncharacterized protein n=1 Tax=Hibiscus sabdariffa TaxID=183260 RepID=A0ABR2S4R1_9ROSI